VGKSRVVVANSVRLLALPATVRAWIGSGDLSVGHAKVLLGLDRAEEQNLIAERIRKDNLTVRATERLIASLHARNGPTRKAGKKSSAPAVLADVEKRLQQHFGTRVRLAGSSDAGRIEIHYFTAQELDRVLQMMRLPSA
jgi:ParB family chromosome partitioning protein